jgi:hypothetical protein
MLHSSFYIYKSKTAGARDLALQFLHLQNYALHSINCILVFTFMNLETVCPKYYRVLSVEIHPKGLVYCVPHIQNVILEEMKFKKLSSVRFSGNYFRNNLIVLKEKHNDVEILFFCFIF